MRSIAWDDESQQLKIIDQLALPGELRYLEINSSAGLADALTSAAVNGAQASAICGAYGLYFASREVETRDPAVLQEAVRKYREHIMAARPTGCCLRDLTSRIVRQADAFEGEVDDLRAFILGQPKTPLSKTWRLNARFPVTGRSSFTTKTQSCITGILVG